MGSRSSFALLPLLLLTLPACEPDRGEEAGDSCDATRTALAIDAASALGFSGADLLTNVEKQYTTTLEWSDGTTTELTLEVDYTTGDATFVDLELSEDSGIEPAAEAAAICEDYLEVPVTLTFSTADGAFNESWSGPLMATQAVSAWFRQDLDLDNLVGSFELREMNPAEYDSVKAWINATFENGETSGNITEQGEKQEGETVSAAATESGSWPAGAGEE